MRSKARICLVVIAESLEHVAMENDHVNRQEKSATGSKLPETLRKEARFRQGDDLNMPSRYRRHDGNQNQDAQAETGEHRGQRDEESEK